MKYHIILKTNRTKSGEARATISKFFNFSTMKWQWAFEFYKTRKFFLTKNELQDFINANYEIIGY